MSIRSASLTGRVWGRFFGFFLFSFLLAAQVGAQTTQSIPLYSGWNLISVQVGTAGGFSIPQIQAGLDRANSLVSVWAYNPAARTYTSWQSSPTNYPSDLTTVAPGLGYWVQVNTSTVLTLSGPVWSGSNTLVPGWNLVGFPGLSQDPSSTITLDAVFRDRFARVPEVWTFQNGSAIFGGQRFVGYDSTARPAISDLKTIVPGQGYWVYSLDNFPLSPAPTLILAPDTDLADASGQLAQLEPFSASDPRWKGPSSAASTYNGRMVFFAGAEDATTDLNGNGILDDPYTQDTMLFDVGVNTQNITIQDLLGVVWVNFRLFELGSKLEQAGGRAASLIARAPLRSQVRLISVLFPLVS